MDIDDSSGNSQQDLIRNKQEVRKTVPITPEKGRNISSFPNWPEVPLKPQQVKIAEPRKISGEQQQQIVGKQLDSAKQKNQENQEQKQEINVKPVPVKVIEINVPEYEIKSTKESPKAFSNNLLRKEFEETAQSAVSRMEQEKREMEEARKKTLQLEEKLFEETVNNPSTNTSNQHAQSQSSNVLPHLYGVDPELVNTVKSAITNYVQKKDAEFHEDLKRLGDAMKRMGLDQESIQKNIEGFKQALENAVKNVEKDSEHVPRYAPSDFIVDPRLVFVYMPDPIRKIMDDYVNGKIRSTDKYPREE